MRIVGPHLAQFFQYLWLILGAIPMPMSLTEISTEPSACPALIPIRPPSGVNFSALERRLIKQDLFDLALVTDEIAKTLIDCNVEVDAMLGGPLPHKGVRVVYGQGKIKCSNL